MKRSMVICADAGVINVYLIEASKKYNGSCELVYSKKNEEAGKKISDVVSDRQGRFQTGAGNRSMGEAHNLVSERKQRLYQSIASEISKAVDQHQADEVCVSLPRAMMNPVKQKLHKQAASRITKSISADLTKAPIPEIRSRFGV